MQGSVFKRRLPSGRIVWCIQLNLGKDTDGRRRRLYRSGFPRKGDAERELQRLLAQHAAGDFGARSRMTFAALAELWLETYRRSRSASSVYTAECTLRAHLLPALGGMQLDKIDVLVLQRFVNSLSAGSKEGKKPLAPTSTARVVAVLRSIMRQAYLWKLIASRDLTRDLSLPRIEIRSRTLPDPARLQQFLAFLREKDPDLHALAVVGLSTGLRRGEMLALKWSNIDWQRSLLYVVGSLSKVHGKTEVKGTKTGQVRVIALPAAAAEVLKQHRLRQEERRRFYGAAYRTDLDLVFGNDHGGFLDPSATSKRFGALSQSCGLDLTLHGLRHLHASLLLAYGAGLPLVSSRLGHATTQTTARQYAHVLQSDLDVAAQLWNTRIAPLLQPPDSASGSGKPN